MELSNETLSAIRKLIESELELTLDASGYSSFTKHIESGQFRVELYFSGMLPNNPEIEALKAQALPYAYRYMTLRKPELKTDNVKIEWEEGLGGWAVNTRAADGQLLCSIALGYTIQEALDYLIAHTPIQA